MNQASQRPRHESRLSMIPMYEIIWHSNFHPKSLNNGFLRQWSLDYQIVHGT